MKMENHIKEKEILLVNNGQEKEKLLQRIQELEIDMNKKVVRRNKIKWYFIIKIKDRRRRIGWKGKEEV